ncbi:MAG: hypothetical protein LBC42_01935 [Puniceicoccales bacterium]|jgi:hypothetical protein|nr:hypothetical protein [Puniceicoccales bacterium]
MTQRWTVLRSALNLCATDTCVSPHLRHAIAFSRKSLEYALATGEFLNKIFILIPLLGEHHLKNSQAFRANPAMN